MRLHFFIASFLLVFSQVRAQTAVATSDVVDGCAPLVVQFDGTSSTGTGTITYHWDFGNGNTSIGTGQGMPGAVYTTPGNYTVSLEIEDDNGFSAPTTINITVFQNPVTSLALTGPSDGCSPLNTSFQDLTTPGNAPITTWIWDFGDGNSSGDQNPSHTYFNQGVYNVALITRDANNCQGDTTFTTLVTVGFEQNVEFNTALPNDNRLTCTNTLTVNFEDQTVLNGTGPYSYEWDFGDGATSTSQNTTHTYTNFGSYDVTLSVTDLFANCETSLTKNQFINLLDVNPSFSYTPALGCQSQTVTFTNTSNTLEGNQIVTWDFGDGTSITGPAQDPGILSPSHTYGPGLYTPSMSVDINGGECIETYMAPTPIVVKDFPTVSFVGDTLNACGGPFTVQFTSNPSETVTYDWDFGDGNTSTAANPSHTYTSEGTFDVSVTVTDSIGCEATATINDYINIDPPEALFTSDIFDNAFLPDTWDNRDINLVAGGCLPLDIMFIDQSTSLMPIVDWDWDFGDGGTSAGVQNPTNTYLTEGEFLVSLTVTTIDGCTDTYLCDSCAVAGNPPDAQVDTSLFPLQQCCEAAHNFINLTTPGTADYFWYETSTGAFEGTDSTVNSWNYFEELLVNPNPMLVDFNFYAWNYGCVDSMEYSAFTTLHQPVVAPNITVDPCIYEDSLHIDNPIVLGLVDSISWSFSYNNQMAFDTLTPSFVSPITAGNQTLSVTAWDLTNTYNLTNGDSVCSCTREVDTYFPGIPIAYDFTTDVDSGCVPLSVNFGGPSDNVAEWDWNFGNSLTSTDQNPTSTYDTIGEYNVQLIITDNGGCTHTVSKVQFIDAIGTNVYINASSIEGCIPFTTNLSDTSAITAPIVSRTWIFGDGDTLIGNDSTTSHTYTDHAPLPALQKDGIQLTLTTVDSNGCVSIGALTVFPSSPTAVIDTSVTPLCLEDSYTFTAGEDDTLGIVPFTYQWDLDNPNPSSGTDQIETKAYPEGSYTVQLIVEDSLGCTDTSSAFNFSVVAPQPQAGFSSDVTVATCPPVLATFTDTSIIGRAPITEWYWDFGDSATSQLQNPANIYSTENSFDVLLVATDSLGCVDSAFVPGVVTLSGVIGSFQVFNNIVCESDSATFIATSPNAARFTWDFGDGNIGFGDSIVHTYTFAATRFPSLIMEDSTGLCSSTFTDTVTVLPLPILDLGGDQDICIGSSLDIGVFLDSTETALWNTSATTDSITINTTGQYSVEVFNTATGCANTDSMFLLVRDLPTIISSGDKSVCLGSSTSISASSTTDTIATYEWFGAGNSLGLGDTLSNLTIDSNTVFVVIGEDIHGCINDTSLQITVVMPPVVNLSDTSICPGASAAISGVPVGGSVVGETFEWLENGQFVSDSSVIIINNAAPYSLTYSVGECMVNATFTSTLDVSPVVMDETAYFCSETENGTNISPGVHTAYFWYFDSSTGSSLLAPTGGVYLVDVTNEFNCTITDSIEVIDQCPPRVFIGNAFSPNNDGNNDLFLPKGDNVDQFEMTIFNRWGEVIFYSTDINNAWDGTYLGELMPEGVYPWLITYNGEHPDHKEKTKLEGRVTLIR